jgi:hypothetical protein
VGYNRDCGVRQALQQLFISPAMELVISDGNSRILMDMDPLILLINFFIMKMMMVIAKQMRTLNFDGTRMIKKATTTCR